MIFRTHLLRRPAIAVFAAVLAGSATAHGGSFFGPNDGFELQPQANVYYSVDPDLRLLFQLQSALIPSHGQAEIAVGGFADWSLAPLLRQLLSPDRGKTRALNIRVGIKYADSLAPGAVGTSQDLALQLEFTPRYFFPGSLLLSNRNRLEARWRLTASEPFSFRYRGRLQVEREFDVGKFGLTPFANVEWVWQDAPAKWTQFRMEAGLQWSIPGPGRGQVLELNYSTVTYLQPSRSWRPIVGVVWYIYF